MSDTRGGSLSPTLSHSHSLTLSPSLVPSLPPPSLSLSLSLSLSGHGGDRWIGGERERARECMMHTSRRFRG